MSEITPVHFLRYKIIPKNNLSLGRAFPGLSAVSIYYTLFERLWANHLTNLNLISLNDKRKSNCAYFIEML